MRALRLFAVLLLAPAVYALSAGASPGGGKAADDVLLRVSGAYLAYSYDHGQIYGERVAFKLGGWDVACRGLKIDLASRSVLAFGAVELKKDGAALAADELIFDLPAGNPALLRYGDLLEVLALDPPGPLEEKLRAGLPARRKALDELTLARLQGSLVYFAGKTFEIADSLEVTGYDVTLFIEGIPSVGFAKFSLSLGDKQRTNGLSLDKIWYTKTQGLFGKASFSFQRETKIDSLTELYYEEHSILKDYAGLPRQFDLQSNTTLALGAGSRLGLAANYNSTSLWNTRLWIDRAWNADKNKLQFDLAYNKPLQGRDETWIGAQASLDFGAGGRLAIQGKYEIRNQALATLGYNAVFLKRLSLAVQSSYSRILAGGLGGVSRIFTGSANLTYRADLFSLGTDYFLNEDLQGDTRLTRPQLRMAFNPVTFYGGLLTATLQNVFVVNDFARSGAATRAYNNNSALTVAAAPIAFGNASTLQVNLAFEQFLEKQGRNFTSGGLILRSSTRLLESLTLEGFYSVQSRRKSTGWLIEGTTSQDLSGVLRFAPGDRLRGWVSVSYDPKNGEWKQSFADVTVGLIKNWNFQSLLSYDFYRKTIANVDLYLIRHAGRFDLRFIWRSISKQFLIELIPAI